MVMRGPWFVGLQALEAPLQIMKAIMSIVILEDNGVPCFEDRVRYKSMCHKRL